MHKGVRKEIREKGEAIIDDVEQIISRINDLDSLAQSKGHPHLHFYSFRNDLQTLVNQFKRMLR